MEGNAYLQQLFGEFWKWRMSSTPEFATMSGEKKFDDQIEHYTLERFHSDNETCNNFLDKLDKIKTSGLNKTDKLNMDLFRAELQTFIEGYKFQGFLFPINFLEGVHVDFQRIAEWMTFKDKGDYDNLIERYNKFPHLVEEICQVLRTSLEKKMTYHANSMKGVVQKFYDHGNSNQSAESTEFYKPFENVEIKDISEQQLKQLKNSAADAIQNKIKPAMLQMAEFLENEYLIGTRKEIAATSLPGGEEFYKACLKFHTSTNLTALEIHQIGIAEVERIESSMKDIVSKELKKGDLELKTFFEELRNDQTFFFSSPQELVDHFKNILNVDINPKLTSIFLSPPKLPLEVVEMPEHMGGGPAAYYIAGTADGSRAGKFFVNTKRYDSQPRYECISLALHEGNPGHHLQSSYSMVVEPPLPKFRQFMEDRSYYLAPSRFPINTAFVEGWALYCEDLGNDLGIYKDPYDRIGHYSMEMIRACRLVVDTGMHALGWSRQRAIDFMKKHTAASEENICSEIDRYITWPGQAVGYKIGEIKIKEMRKYAENKLGDSFDIRTFHEVILRCAGPIDILEKEVQEYVKTTLTKE